MGENKKEEIVCSTCKEYDICFPINHQLRKQNIIIVVENCGAYIPKKLRKEKENGNYNRTIGKDL